MQFSKEGGQTRGNNFRQKTCWTRRQILDRWISIGWSSPPSHGYVVTFVASIFHIARPNFYHSIGDESFAFRQKWNEDKGEEEEERVDQPPRSRLRLVRRVHPFHSSLRSSNGKVFTGMAGFVWNDATRRRGSNGTLNEIRVCSSFVIVPPLARINFSKNFSSSLIFARSFSESFIRFRFGINSLFIHILYFRIFVPPCVVVFVLFPFWFLILYFAILFRFILYSFILCFIWFVNKKKIKFKD